MNLHLSFLNQVDVAIAGDSGILLEAALVNVYPIYFDFRKVHLDHYGFEKNGLVERFTDVNKLLNKLDNLVLEKMNIRSKAKQYCESVNTVYDGRSSELASKLINETSEYGRINQKHFKRISNINLNAYNMDYYFKDK